MPGKPPLRANATSTVPHPHPTAHLPSGRPVLRRGSYGTWKGDVSSLRCTPRSPARLPMPERKKPIFSATGMVLFLLCLMSLVTYIDRVNIATAAEPMRKEFGLSYTQLGVALGAFGYAYLILQITGGWI